MEQPKSGLAPTVFLALLRPLLRSLAKTALPRYRGTVTLSALDNQVEVRWQNHAIPHVFAANEQDLFRAQGYLHAQERLWQMEMTRRFLAGRMAEIFGGFSVPWKELSSQFRGKNSVEFDYFMRLMGIRRAALTSLQLLSEADHQRLRAYSDGVNRYVEQCGKRLPWEFRLLRFEPDPWRPEDSLTIGKGFAFLLSTALFTRLNTIALAAKLVGQPEKLHSLRPLYPEDGPSITQAAWESAKGLWQFMNGTFSATDWNPAGHGSNNWVIEPSRSESGAAILCNDPHLRLGLPAIWYLMHLKADPTATQPDGYEVWGASIPGSPCIHLGHNRYVAWGVTAALCDDVELYREKIHPLEPDRYLFAHRWLTMESRHEIIGIRRASEINKTVRSTRHGPIISDFHGALKSLEALSLRWTAHEASQDFRCLYGVNRARNWDEFLESLSHQAAPTLNYVYADQKGNIGYSLAGKIPIRPGVPTLLPLDGWNESNDWREYVPFSELPRIFNPPEGVIATANNRIVESSYPHYLSHFFEPPYRIQRIKELLTSEKMYSIQRMANMQQDVLSLHARELVASLGADLQLITGNDLFLTRAADKLLRWDARCHEASVESTIFHVFYHRLMANLLIPVLGEELFLAYVEIFNQCLAPLDRILTNPNSEWFATRSRKELIAQSFREAMDELREALGNDLEHWYWGRIHTLTLNHGLSRISMLRLFLSIGPFPSFGDGTTVNLGFYRYSDPYLHTVGASLRMITDLSRPLQSRWIMPSGQSGHPFSPYYRDQYDLWHRGEYIALCQDQETMRNWPLLILTPTG